MKIYYVKILLFTFLISTLVLPHNVCTKNDHYNRSSIQNNTQGTTIKSRLLAQTKNHNPHYHNDPEFKEIIDKMNEEAIKKYQQTHDPYKQLKELVEKNGTKLTGANDAEPMSTTEKDLFETYEEVFGEENHIMLKSGIYTNDDDKSNKSSCECTDINNTDLTKRKGKDKYLKHLKHRCIGGICSCSVGSALLTYIGLAFAKSVALAKFAHSAETCASYMTIFNMFNAGNLNTAIQAGGGVCLHAFHDIVSPATTAATAAIFPYSIAIYVLIAITVLLIILYIWLYRRRKNSWKHECKKHLCK
ncbi:stevor [Plasmodium reichenowi]|uniref:Stevor n=1 Tax=Plasmodium reichenowi TaxID=5854 RepID=A0A060RM22_PLARE|nr:stevor [Plasmodium reichenowi]